MIEGLKEKAREIDALFYALVDDVIAATELRAKRNDDFTRRLYVRTVFAAVEGIIQVMKKRALLSHEASDKPLLTPEEITLIREEDLKIDNTGSVKITKKKISLLPNFEFAFKINAKAASKVASFDKSGDGWQSFKKAIKVRHRLMHPNSLADLQISKQDMADVEKAMVFFREVTGKLLHE
jgi:hypothetical protein